MAEICTSPSGAAGAEASASGEKKSVSHTIHENTLDDSKLTWFVTTTSHRTRCSKEEKIEISHIWVLDHHTTSEGASSKLFSYPRRSSESEAMALILSQIPNRKPHCHLPI